MAYFGKEFKFEKEENFKEFLGSLGIPQEKINKLQEYRPNVKLVKEGDKYTLSFISAQGNKEVVFKNGEAFDEDVSEDHKSKTTVTVNGDTFTQVQNFGADNKTVTYKREFTAKGLKLTVTASGWDGVAYRYYVPA